MTGDEEGKDGDSGTMLLDLVGVKRRFIELLEKTHPNVVPQFTSWLDMKVSEYKVNGYMVTDCEITAVPTWINNVFKSALLDPTTAQQLRQTGIEAAMYSYAAANPHGQTPGNRTNPSASPSPSLPLYRQLNGEDGTPPLKRKRPSSSPRTSGPRDSVMTSPSPGLLPPMGMTPDSAVTAAAQHTAAQYLKNLLQRRADPNTPASDAVSPRPVQHSSPIKPRADKTPSKPEAETVESRDATDGALNLTVSSNGSELKSEPLDLSEHPEAEGDVSGERPRHRRRKPEGPMKIQAQASGDEMDQSVTSPSDAQAAQQSPIAPPRSAGFDQPSHFDASQRSPSQTFPHLLSSLSHGETITGSHMCPGIQVTAGGLTMASPAGGEVKYSMGAAAFMSRELPRDMGRVPPMAGQQRPPQPTSAKARQRKATTPKHKAQQILLEQPELATNLMTVSRDRKMKYGGRCIELDGRRFIECHVCHKVVTEGAYYRHAQMHSGSPRHTCAKCHKQFYRRDKWREHSMMCTGKPRVRGRPAGLYGDGTSPPRGYSPAPPPSQVYSHNTHPHVYSPAPPSAEAMAAAAAAGLPLSLLSLPSMPSPYIGFMPQSDQSDSRDSSATDRPSPGLGAAPSPPPDSEGRDSTGTPDLVMAFDDNEAPLSPANAATESQEEAGEEVGSSEKEYVSDELNDSGRGTECLEREGEESEPLGADVPPPAPVPVN